MKILIALSLLVLFASCQNQEALDWVTSLQEGVPELPAPEGIVDFDFEIVEEQGDPSFLFNPLQNNGSVEIFTIVLDADSPQAGSLVQIREVNGAGGRVIFQLTEAVNGSANSISFSVNSVTNEISFQLIYESNTYTGHLAITSITKINRTLYVGSIMSAGSFEQASIAYSSSVDITNDPASIEVTGEFQPTEENNPYGMTFSKDGYQLFIVGSQRKLFQYDLVEPFNLSSGVSYANAFFDVSDKDPQIYDIAFSPDGANMYIMGLAFRKIHQYRLSNPFDISADVTYAGELSLANEGFFPTGMTFDPSGTKLFVSNANQLVVDQYTLNTPWDVFGGANYDGSSMDISSEDDVPNDIAFNADGSKMYIIGAQKNNVYQYSLADPWNVLSGMTFDGSPFDISLQESGQTGIAFSSDYTQLYTSGRNVHQYQLGANGFVETAADDGSVEGEIIFTLEGDTFVNAGGSLTSPTHFIINNLPADLTPSMVIGSDGTTATLTLGGNALANDDIDDVSDLQYTFTDAAFTNSNANNITNAINISTNLGINFIESQSSETDITSYSFSEQIGITILNDATHTVDIEVICTTDVSALVSTFVLSTGASAEVGTTAQISGETLNDFTNPLTYTITAEDGVTIQDWLVTISLAVDIITPVADLTSLPDLAAECSVTTLTAPTATDDCAGTITATHDASLPITIQGTTIVTWTYDDGNGNLSTQIQNVVIEDISAPVADAVLNDIEAECTVTSLSAPTATDNCIGTITGTHDASLPITTQGTTIVIWTYDDGNGNISTQTQNVVIKDISAPVADATLNDIAAECSVTSLSVPTGTDNCSGTITGTHNASLPITTQGTTTVTWTYDDGNGNISTQSQNVIIADNVDPIITAPANIVISADIGSCEAGNVDLSTPITSDNCSVEIVTNDALTTYPVGTTIVTWTVTDAGGNIATAIQNVVVEDNEPPVALGQNIFATLDVFGNISISAADVDGGSSDNCQIASQAIDITDFNCADIGENAVTLTVTDNSGNVSSSTAIVTVIGTDTDGDGICDTLDNCPNTSNSTQTDADQDAFGAACDCNDLDASINPLETDTAGSGVDANCDGQFTWYIDFDLDSYGSEILTTSSSSVPGLGESINNLDCNDSDVDQFPGQIWYEDADGDGFGNPNVFVAQCLQPTGYVIDNQDTDDTNEFINPNNAAPISNAGPDQTITVGESAQFDGAGSSDPDFNTLNYSWMIISSPAGSMASLSDRFIVNPIFTANIAGEYIIQLIVNDGLVDGSADQVTLTVLSAQEALDIIVTNIEELVSLGILNNGNGNALIGKIEGAIDKMDKGNINAASNKIQSFINQVNAFISSGKLTSAEGQPLIDAANGIIELMSNPSARTRSSSGTDSSIALAPDQTEIPEIRVTVYPNPFQNKINIEYFSLNKSEVEVRIFNLSGKVIEGSIKFQTEEFQLYQWDIPISDHLPEGVYFIMIGNGTDVFKKLLMHF